MPNKQTKCLSPGGHWPETADGSKYSRRRFLRYGLEAGVMVALVGGLSLLPTRAGYIRPPGAAAEDAFHKKCLKCGACIEACPTGAITQLDLSLDLKNLATPVMEPKHGGCLAWSHPCLKCVDACPTDALIRPESLTGVKLAKVVIEGRECVNCMLCFLKCPVEGAVLFPNPQGEAFTRESHIPTALKTVHSPLKPYIDQSKCVGCGLCAHYCPVDVIRMQPMERGPA